jgi:hypothetical protein
LYRYAKERFELELRRRRDRWKADRIAEAAARAALLLRREQEAKDRVEKLLQQIADESAAIKKKILVSRHR